MDQATGPGGRRVESWTQSSPYCARDPDRKLFARVMKDVGTLDPIIDVLKLGTPMYHWATGLLTRLSTYGLDSVTYVRPNPDTIDDPTRRLCVLQQYAHFTTLGVLQGVTQDVQQWRRMDWENNHAALAVLYRHLDKGILQDVQARTAQYLRSTAGVVATATFPSVPFPLAFMHLVELNANLAHDALDDLKHQWKSLTLRKFAGLNVHDYVSQLRRHDLTSSA